MAISESLGDSIKCGRGRGGRGYLTHKHQGKGVLFSHICKPYILTHTSNAKCFRSIILVKNEVLPK